MDFWLELCYTMFYNANESGEISLFCQKCGHNLDEGDKFCVECGAKVVQTMSEETEDKGDAGTNQTDSVWDVAAPSGQFAEEKPHYKKNTGIIVGIICGLGVLFILILFISVSLVGNRAKKNLNMDDFPFRKEEPQDDDEYDLDDDFDFDDDFGFGNNRSEDYFGDYF